MPLDLSSSEKALGSLKKAVAELQKDTDNEFVKDSVVQRFEYTHEVTYKILRRFLVETEEDAKAVKEMSFQEIIRTACERGLLLQDLRAWNVYRTMRNTTSRTYDGSKADYIIAGVSAFIVDAEFLLGKLQQKITSLETGTSNAVPPGGDHAGDA